MPQNNMSVSRILRGLTVLVATVIFSFESNGARAEDSKLLIVNSSNRDISFICLSWVEQAENGDQQLKEATYIGLPKSATKGFVLDVVGSARIQSIYWIYDQQDYGFRVWGDGEDGKNALIGKLVIRHSGVELHSALQENDLPGLVGYPILNVNIGGFLEPGSAAKGLISEEVQNAISLPRILLMAAKLSELPAQNALTTRDWCFWKRAYLESYVGCIVAGRDDEPHFQNLLKIFYPEYVDELKNPFFSPESASVTLREKITLAKSAHKEALVRAKQK